MSLAAIVPLRPRSGGTLAPVREAGGGGHWITLHAADSDEGTVHVFIGGNGRVTKGPSSLVGSAIGHLASHPSVKSAEHHPPGHEPPGARAHPQYTEHQPPSTEKPAPLPGKPYARLHGAPQTRQEQPKEGPSPKPLTKEQTHAGLQTAREQAKAAKGTTPEAKAADTAVAHQQAQADLAAYRASKDRNPNPWAPHLSPPVNDAKDRELAEKATRAQLAHQAVQAQQQQAAAAQQQEGQRAHDKEMVRLKADVAPKPAITPLDAPPKPTGPRNMEHEIEDRRLQRSLERAQADVATYPAGSALGRQARADLARAKADMRDAAARRAQAGPTDAYGRRLGLSAPTATAKQPAETEPITPLTSSLPAHAALQVHHADLLGEHPDVKAFYERASGGTHPDPEKLKDVMAWMHNEGLKRLGEPQRKEAGLPTPGTMAKPAIPAARAPQPGKPTVGEITKEHIQAKVMAGEHLTREEKGFVLNGYRMPVGKPKPQDATQPATPAEQPKAEAKPALVVPQKAAAREKPAMTEPAPARGHVVKDPVRGDHFLLDHPDAIREYSERAERARAYNQRYPDAHRSMKDSAAEYNPSTHHVAQTFDKQGRVERTFHVAKDNPQLAQTQPVSGKDVPLSIRKHQDLQERLGAAGSDEERMKIHARQRYDPLPMAERAIAKADKPDIAAEGRANTAAQLAEGARRYAERGTSGYDHLSDPTHPVHEEIARAAPTFGQRNAHIGRIQALTQAQHKMEDAFAKVAGRGAAAAEHPLKAEHDQALARIAARIAHHSTRADALRPAADAESAAVAKILARYAPAAKKSKVRESAGPAPRFVAPSAAAR